MKAESPQALRADLVARLNARIPEIKKAIFRRIESLSDPVGREDPAYIAGLQRALADALNYGLEGIEVGRESSLPIPPETARQARRAAREGVRLDTVLRRYVAGNKALEEFVVAEAEGIPGRLLCQILGDQSPHVDRLMESVAAEYRDELEKIERSSAQKQADHILHFFEGDSFVAPADADYDFNLWHVGMILTGHGGEMSVRALAKGLGCRSLSLVRDHETVWAWLGSAQQPDVAELGRFLNDDTSKKTFVAIGEPRKGPDGWRQTLREAQAALQVMLYRPQSVMRCRNVILESAILRNPFLATSLIETYLTPLDEVLRRTLRAYFKADQNAASTASALDIARHTVERRLRRIEKRLGQNIDTCNAQLRVALSVEELLTCSGQMAQPVGA